MSLLQGEGREDSYIIVLALVVKQSLTMLIISRHIAWAREVATKSVFVYSNFNAANEGINTIKCNILSGGYRPGEDGRGEC